MRLTGKYKLVEKGRSKAEVIVNSLPGDTLELVIDTKKVFDPKYPKSSTPTITVTNIETGESATKYYKQWVSILNKLKLEEVTNE